MKRILTLALCLLTVPAFAANRAKPLAPAVPKSIVITQEQAARIDATLKQQADMIKRLQADRKVTLDGKEYPADLNVNAVFLLALKALKNPDVDKVLATFTVTKDALKDATVAGKPLAAAPPAAPPVASPAESK